MLIKIIDGKLNIPNGSTIGINFILQREKYLERLPANLSCLQDMVIYHCGAIHSSPDNLTINGDCVIDYCSKFSSFGVNTIIGKHLTIRDCSLIASLPDDLQFQNLTLDSLGDFQKLPSKIKTNSLILKRLPKLKELPDSLILNGDLLLEDCEALRKLPNGLFLNDELILSRMSNLKPDYFLGDFEAYDCGAFVYVPNIGSEDGTLRLGRDGSVKRGCFNGSLDEFIIGVIKKHKDTVYFTDYRGVVKDWGEILKKEKLI